MGIFYAGLDLGQQGDYTALAILERVEVQVGEPQVKRVEYQPDLPSWWASSEYAQVYGAHAVPPDWPVIVEERVVPAETCVEFHLRHLERPELGTPYPRIVERVCALLSRPPLSGPQAETTLIVDATGVGRPVIDLLRARDLPGALVPITITGADSVTRDDHGREWRVPKRDLVGVLQVLLQTGRLKVAEGLPLGATLAAEMLNFKAKISASGHDTYEAGPAGGEWREGAHDDLVLAVTLPCWYAEQANHYGPRVTFLDW